MPIRLPFPLPTFAFYQRLTARERVLLLIVGGSLVVIVNLILLSVLIRSWRDLSLQYTEKSQELYRETAFADQKASLWQPRNEWLKKTQPPLANRSLAGPQLQEAIKGIAQGNQVIVTNQKFVTATTAAAYQPVTVGISTQSDWKSVVKFMATLQRPDAFLVFNTASLHTEQSDPAQVKGEFVISKWYAPAAK